MFFVLVIIIKVQLISALYIKYLCSLFLKASLLGIVMATARIISIAHSSELYCSELTLKSLN